MQNTLSRGGLSARFAGLLLALCLGGASAAADLPNNELPLYGGAPETDPLRQADLQQIKRLEERGVARDQASESASQTGWQAFREGDYGLAMRRFNLGWLLDPQNGQIYWGMAVTVEARDQDYTLAAELFDSARTLLPDDADLLVDNGRLMGLMRRVDTSIEYFEQALIINPDVRAAHQGLAIAFFKTGEYTRALTHAEAAEARGEPLPEDFVEKLRERAE